MKNFLNLDSLSDKDFIIVFTLLISSAVIALFLIILQIRKEYSSINALHPMIENQIIKLISDSDQKVKTIYYEDKKIEFFYLPEKDNPKSMILVSCDESPEYKGMTIIHNNDGRDIIITSPKILNRIKMKILEDEQPQQ